MIHRINFLERGRYALTYQNMAMAMGVWVAMCLAVHGIFLAQGGWTRGKVLVAREAVKVLTAEFEQQVRLTEASKSAVRTGSAIQSLAWVFQQLPRWSRALDGVAAAMPNQVWLTLVKSTAVAGDPARHVELEGYGRSAEAITRFLQRLDETPLFSNVVLTRSSKQEGEADLLFTATADLRFSGT